MAHTCKPAAPHDPPSDWCARRELDNLNRFVQILLEWDEHQRTIDGTGPDSEGADNHGSSEPRSDGGRVRPRVLEGPRTRGLLNPGAAQAPPHLRTRTPPHDPAGVRGRRNRQARRPRRLRRDAGVPEGESVLPDDPRGEDRPPVSDYPRLDHRRRP